MKSDSFRARQMALIEDGGNITKKPLLLEAAKFVFWLTAAIGILYVALGIFVNIYIAKMSPAAQNKLEAFLRGKPHPNQISLAKQYQTQLKILNDFKAKILESDPSLKNRSPLNIYIADVKDINAFLTMGGDIGFTSGMLDEVKDEQSLAFVLAHEIGHYSKRHHLKRAGNGIVVLIISSIVGLAGESHLSKLSSSITDLASVRYSQEQEEEADAYANAMVLKVFKTNQGAINFFETLQKKNGDSVFLSYFSNHPSTQSRIDKLKLQQCSL